MLGPWQDRKGLPMPRNPASGQLYSVGKDGKDDSEDVTLDITVSASLDMTTASQCRLQPQILTGDQG